MFCFINQKTTKKKTKLGCTGSNISILLGKLFLNYQSCTFFNQLSFQLVLYICILYVYNSNRDILPGVNACLYIFFIVERKRRKKRQSSHLWWFLSCQHFVWSHWQGDMMPYFTLWISEDSWNRCVKGVLLHCSLLWSYYAYLLCYIDFGLWRCTGLSV